METGLLDKILNTGLGVFSTVKQTEAANNSAKANQAAATAASAQQSKVLKLALIGAAVVAVLVGLAMVFRK